MLAHLLTGDERKAKEALDACINAEPTNAQFRLAHTLTLSSARDEGVRNSCPIGDSQVYAAEGAPRFLLLTVAVVRAQYGRYDEAAKTIDVLLERKQMNAKYTAELKHLKAAYGTEKIAPLPHATVAATAILWPE